MDMSSFERPISSSLYVAVLNKDDPSPLAPESDEEPAKDEKSPDKEKSDEKPDEKNDEEEEKPVEVKIDEALLLPEGDLNNP